MTEATQLTLPELEVCKRLRIDPELYAQHKNPPRLSAEEFAELSKAEAEKLGVKLEEADSE